MDSNGHMTRKYKVVRGNFSRIVNSLEQNSKEVVMAAFEQNLIAQTSFKEYMNGNKDNCNFVLEILTRIELNEEDFDVFIDCLRASPCLKALVSNLIRELENAMDTIENESTCEEMYKKMCELKYEYKNHIDRCHCSTSQHHKTEICEKRTSVMSNVRFNRDSRKTRLQNSIYKKGLQGERYTRFKMLRKIHG